MTVYRGCRNLLLAHLVVVAVEGLVLPCSGSSSSCRSSIAQQDCETVISNQHVLAMLIDTEGAAF